ncbi:MAG: hypothetical protein ACE5JM_17150 [Armatimonadota bacterium]
MKKSAWGWSCIVLLAACAASTCCAGAAAADEVAGVIALLAGNMRVEGADGSVTRVAAASAVRPGDTVVLGKSARAVLFQSTQPPISLQPGSDLSIGPEPVPAKAGLDSPAIAALWKRLQFWLAIDRIKRLTEVDAATIARDTAARAKPSNTCIATERPKFSWPRVSGARNYAFSITEVTETGENRFYSAATAKTQMAYPGTKPPLTPGVVYRWEAVGGDARREKGSHGGWIVLLPEGKLSAVREAEQQLRLWGATTKDQYAAGLLLAERYCGDALYELAHTQLRKLARTEKTDPIVATFLADVASERERPPAQWATARDSDDHLAGPARAGFSMRGGRKCEQPFCTARATCASRMCQCPRRRSTGLC